MKKALVAIAAIAVGLVLTASETSVAQAVQAGTAAKKELKANARAMKADAKEVTKKAAKVD